MNNLSHWFSAIGMVGAIAATPFAVLAQSPSPMIPSASTPEAMPHTHRSARAKTIADIAATNSSFKTLNAAVKAAGLTQALSGKEPLTLFAPTDAAFAKLPKGAVEALLKPENKAKLIKLLTYHVVAGSVLSTDLKSGDVKTIEGSTVAVQVGTAGVEVNNAKVIKADIKASNGIIHVIDTVIVPPDLSASRRKPSGMMMKPVTPTQSTPVTPAQPTMPMPR